MQYKVELPHSGYESHEQRAKAYRALFDNADGHPVLMDILINLCQIGGNISAKDTDHIREKIGRQAVGHDLINILYERD